MKGQVSKDRSGSDYSYNYNCPSTLPALPCLPACLPPLPCVPLLLLLLLLITVMIMLMMTILLLITIIMTQAGPPWALTPSS